MQTSPWERTRLFVQPRALALACHTFTYGNTIHIALKPVAQSLAFLWDLQVHGVACLPPAALLELTAAGCASAHHSVGADMSVAVADCTLGVPCVLEESATATDVVCVIDQHTGHVVIRAKEQQLLTAQISQAISPALDHQVVTPTATAIPVLKVR